MSSSYVTKCLIFSLSTGDIFVAGLLVHDSVIRQVVSVSALTWIITVLNSFNYYENQTRDHLIQVQLVLSDFGYTA
jgi:hypothetical protein